MGGIFPETAWRVAYIVTVGGVAHTDLSLARISGPGESMENHRQLLNLRHDAAGTAYVVLCQNKF